MDLFSNETLKPVRREGLFGGQGGLSLLGLLPRAELSPFASVAAIQLEPSTSVGEFREETNPELLIVVEGTGTAVLDGTDVALSAGSVLQIGIGSTLAVKNDSGEEPLSYLIVKGTGPAPAP